MRLFISGGSEAFITRVLFNKRRDLCPQRNQPHLVGSVNPRKWLVQREIQRFVITGGEGGGSTSGKFLVIRCGPVKSAFPE